MKKIIAVISGLIMAMAVFLVPTPAQASSCSDGWCTTIVHLNDSGYDGYNHSFHLSCSNGTEVLVPENTSSASKCQDVYMVYVRSDENYRCKQADGNFAIIWNSPGWHKAGNTNRWCVLARDTTAV